MGLFTRLLTKLSTSTVRRTLRTAPPEKLVKHYNTLTEAYRLTDDVKQQLEISRLQRDILAELERRGIKTGRT